MIEKIRTEVGSYLRAKCTVLYNYDSFSCVIIVTPGFWQILFSRPTVKKVGLKLEKNRIICAMFENSAILKATIAEELERFAGEFEIPQVAFIKHPISKCE